MAFDFDDLEEGLAEVIDAEVLAILRPALKESAATSAATVASEGVEQAARKPGRRSPWLPHGGCDLEGSALRLFCFYGAGKQAHDFKAWSEAALRGYPSVRVCPVELPGHALHPGDSESDAHAIAERFCREVLDELPAAGAVRQPFALFGFSTGARIAFEVARRRLPVRLYVAGRAAPAVRARRQGEASEHAALRNDAAKTMRWATSMWGTAREQQNMERLIKQAEADGDWEMLKKFAKTVLDDLELGSTELRNTDSAGNPLVKTLRCRVYVYEASEDSSWPPSLIADTWDACQAAGRTEKKTYPGMSHDELCAQSGEPLLLDVLSNLDGLLREAGLAGG